jgi:hypothetical protein
MGRLSQLFWYINETEHPKGVDVVNNYTYLSIGPEEQEIRKNYRKRFKTRKHKRIVIKRKVYAGKKFWSEHEDIDIDQMTREYLENGGQITFLPKS